MGCEAPLLFDLAPCPRGLGVAAPRAWAPLVVNETVVTEKGGRSTAGRGWPSSGPAFGEGPRPNASRSVPSAASASSEPAPKGLLGPAKNRGERSDAELS